jgi:hypothetical protein
MRKKRAGTKRDPKDQEECEATRIRFSHDDLEALLLNCENYIDQRRKELEGPLTAGVKLDTGDPYLIGYTTGMRAGLEMASNLVGSYQEWVRRKIYHPDAAYPRK